MADVFVNPKHVTWCRVAPSGGTQIGLVDGMVVDTSESQEAVAYLIGQLSDRLVTIVDATIVNPA